VNRRRENIGIDRDFDHRIEAGLTCQAQNCVGLSFAQNQRVDISGSEFVETLAERELLAQVERRTDSRQAHRLQPEFVVASAEKLSVDSN
jgi:hypothetical protein